MKMVLKITMMVLFGTITAIAQNVIASSPTEVVKTEVVERKITERVLSTKEAKKAVHASQTTAKKKKSRILHSKKKKKFSTPTAVTRTAVTKEVSITAKTMIKKSEKIPLRVFLKTVFGPDELTNTPRADHLILSYGIRMFDSTNSSNQPTGFQTEASDLNTVEGDFAINMKIWRVGLEYRPLEHHSMLETKFYGASLGTLDVITSNVIIGKFYAVDNHKWSAFVGLGTESTKINGAVEMGGFKFKTTGDGWTPVLQLGCKYNLNRYWSLEAIYEKSNVVVTTQIPGVPDLRTTRDDRFIARVNLGLF